MERNSCESTPSHWSKSSGSHTEGDIAQVRHMKDQIQTLMKLNTQLTTKLDSVNSELRQALVTAAKVNPLHDEIIQLNNKLLETKSKHKKVQQELYHQVNELTEQLNTTQQKYYSDIQNYNHTVLNSTQENTMLRKQIEILQEENQQLKSEVKQLASVNHKLVKQRSKLSNKLKDFESQLNAQDMELDDVYEANEMYDSSNKSLSKKIEYLKGELNQIILINTELEMKLNDEHARYKSAQDQLDQIRPQAENQKLELYKLTEERKRLMDDNQNYTVKLSQTEQELAVAKDSNEKLREKIKKLPLLNPTHFADTIDLNNLNLPFEDDVSVKLREVLDYKHFQPIQKVQLLINELSKELTSKVNSLKQVTQDYNQINTQYKELNYRCRRVEELLVSLTTVWKNFEFIEKEIDATAFAHADRKFLSLISREGTHGLKLIESYDLINGSQPQPFDIFADYASERRQQILNYIADNNKEVSELVSVLFLVNTRLKKEVDTLLKASAKKKDINKTLSKTGISDLSLLPSHLENLNRVVNDLKRTKKELNHRIQEDETKIKKLEKSESTYRELIKNQENSISKLNEEIDSLKHQIKLQNDEIYSKKEELNKYIVTKQNLSEQEQKNEVIRQALDEINEENSKLRNALAMLHVDVSEAKENNIMMLQSKQQEMNNIISSKEMQVKSLCNKLAKTKKKARDIVNNLKHKHETEINALMSEIENQKFQFTEQLEDIKSKNHKNKAKSKYLTNNLSDTEQKNALLLAEKNELQKQLKEADTKICVLQDKILYNNQENEAKLASKIYSIENKYKNENIQIKKQLMKEKNDFVDYIKSKLGMLYGIGDLEIDDNSIDMVFSRLESDLSKLRYFQTEASKNTAM